MNKSTGGVHRWMRGGATFHTGDTVQAKARRYDIDEKFRKLSGMVLLGYNERGE